MNLQHEQISKTNSGSTVTNICVFCSSSKDVRIEHFETARKLGEAIADNKKTLVYGGANVGLMNELAQAAKDRNGKVIGIIPEMFDNKNLSFRGLDELIVTANMHERKAKMEQMSDAFITLPGGFGTFEEIFEIITLKQLGVHKKPIVFINTLNYYDHLFNQLETCYYEKFAKPIYKQLYFVASSVEEALNYIENYRYTINIEKW